MPARFSDPLLRALGADPPVFHAVARAQALLVGRRGYTIRGKLAQRRGRLTGHLGLILAASANGIAMASAMLTYTSPLVGAAFCITGGCGFLLLLVITDFFEALIDPREYAVIAAHPHDDWSVLLAKLAVVGRSIGTLVALMFIPTSIAAGIAFHGVSAGVAFLLGAAGAAVAATAGGMLTGAAALAVLGADRFARAVTVVQVAFLVIVMFTVGGVPILKHVVAAHVSDLGPWAWLVPSLWFVSPLELATGAREPASIVRLLLAAAAIAACAVVGARWISTRVGAELLEAPVRARRAPRRVRPKARFPLGAFLYRGAESHALARLAGAQFRNDSVFRIQFVIIPVMFLLMSTRSLIQAHSLRTPAAHSSAIVLLSFFLAMLLVVQGAPFSRSRQPENLWCVLASPLRRGQFSMALVSVMRLWVLLPGAAIILAYEVFAMRMAWLPAAAGLAKFWAMGELLIRLGRALLPDMPFSRPLRAAGQRAGAQIVYVLLGAFAAGGCMIGSFVAGQFGWAGDLAAAAGFALLAVPAGLWARWRVTRAAERFELAAAEL